MAVRIVSSGTPSTTQMVTMGERPVLGDLIVMELPEGEHVPAGWTEIQGPDGRACWRYVTGGEAWPTRLPSVVVRGAVVATDATDDGSGVPWNAAPEGEQ